MKLLAVRSFEFGIILCAVTALLLFFGFQIPYNYLGLGVTGYKSITGVFLLLYFVDQWRLSRVKVQKLKAGEIQTETYLHRLAGLCGPVLFFLHVQHSGYGYLAILSLSFALTLVTGVLYPKVLQLQKPSLRKGVLVLHVLAATLMTGLAIFHIYSIASFGFHKRTRTSDNRVFTVNYNDRA